jgi:hypothetical protein
MTKAVLEADSQRAVAAAPSSALAVPASLHASLLARLDRLGSAKEVAQIGAVIGREFSHAGGAQAEPGAGLVGAGLLFRQGVPPHATYLFKHALVQDAAYGTLLRERPRVLCELAAQFQDLAEKQGAAVPLMIGHRIMGTALASTGDFAAALAHYD